MRLVAITTASCSAKAPPERPVPLPRAMNGTPSSAQQRTTAATCSVVSGSTTSGGWWRCRVRPSQS